jgi:3',5'-cyclic AMP phosphodiesterase CpdA
VAADEATPRSEPKLFGRLKGMNFNLCRLLADETIRAAHLVLVTGDVTDRGQIIEWERFWQSVADAGLTRRMVVLPGNHDVCCLGLRRQRPRAEDWARARHGLAMGRQDHTFPWIRRHGDDMALFGVDSANAGNLNGLDNAIGRIGHHQLAELGRSLLLYQDIPYKFILLHHSPNIPAPSTSRRRGEKTTPVWERKALQLDPFDRRALRLLARIFRVKAILHGHTHVRLDRHVGGVRIIGAAASTEPDDEGCLSYNYYTLYRGSGTLRASTRRRAV